MSSPDCKRQKLAGDVNSAAEMSNVSAKEDCETHTNDVTITASASNNKKIIIDEGLQYFKDVARLDGFVDRTKFVKKLLDHKPIYVMIFAPSKFGKTINLNMVKFFCDIEDKNTKTKEDLANDPTMQELRSNPSEKMKVFLRQFENKQYEECLILEEEKFFIQHFGRYPVILFDFKDFTARNRSEAIFECAKLVRKSYLDNKYLKNSKEFKPNKGGHVRLKKACAHWCSYNYNDLKKLSECDVIDGLKDLIKSLRIHWGRDPVFLVDEIDKPCIYAMRHRLSKDEVDYIVNVVSSVICSIIKTTDEQIKLQVALITGISKFEGFGLSDVDNTVKRYFLGDDPFSEYYGLTTKEVDSLVKKLFASEGDDEITSIINIIKEHYNGHYQRSLRDIVENGKQIEYARYCLFSVLCYMKERSKYKDVRNMRFWNEGGLIRKLVPILQQKSPVIMNAIHTLIYDHSGTVEVIYEPEVDARDLLGLFNEEITPVPDAILNFFLQRGFLAHNLDKKEEKVGGRLKIHLRIPNLEIRSLYEDMFESYLQSFSADVVSAFISCGEFFKSLPTGLERHMQNSVKFQEALNELCADLTYIFRKMECKNEDTVCVYLCAILKLYAQYEDSQVNYKMQYLDDAGHQKWVFIDVYGKQGNFVFISEIKYNGDANGEPGNFGSKTKSSLAAAEHILQFLPGKEYRENKGSTKAGSVKDVKFLESSQTQFKSFLMGVAVDGDGTTHMLVFPNSTDWKDVITVNAESHVAELISTHLKSK